MKRAAYPDLSASAQPGAEFALHVTTGARRNALDGPPWRARVTAPPEDGRANVAVQKLLARALNVAPSRLALIRGPKSREKLFRLTD